MIERQKPPQKIEVLPSPPRDGVVVVAVYDGAANRQKQHLLQRISDAVRLTRVLDQGEVVQKGTQPRRRTKVRLRQVHEEKGSESPHPSNPSKRNRKRR